MKYTIDMDQYAAENGYYVGLKELKPGINIQAIANFRIAEYFDFRCLPGISFGERQLYFLDEDDQLMYDGKPYLLESSFLELPLLIKYKAHRLNNFRPYLIGGINARYDLGVKKKYDYEEQLIMVSPFDFYTEIGTGMDFYLTYFKFAVEFKYSIGMTDIYRDTDRSGAKPVDFPEYSNIIDGIKSGIFQISFHFE